MHFPAWRKETFFSPRVKTELAVFSFLSFSLNVKTVVYTKVSFKSVWYITQHLATGCLIVRLPKVISCWTRNAVCQQVVCNRRLWLSMIPLARRQYFSLRNYVEILKIVLQLKAPQRNTLRNWIWSPFLKTRQTNYVKLKYWSVKYVLHLLSAVPARFVKENKYCDSTVFIFQVNTCVHTQSTLIYLNIQGKSKYCDFPVN